MVFCAVFGCGEDLKHLIYEKTEFPITCDEEEMGIVEYDPAADSPDPDGDMETLAVEPDEGPEEDGEGQEQFDISLPPTHSYMGSSLTPVRTKAALCGGWRGCLPAISRPEPLYPGEALPLTLLDYHARKLVAKEHSFALLFADESGSRLSGAGVVCETIACSEGGSGREGGRVHLTARAGLPLVAHKMRHKALFDRPISVDVEVYEEHPSTDWLSHVRLPSVAALRKGCGPNAALAKRMEAAQSAVPGFLFHIFDYDKLSTEVRAHLDSLGLTGAPQDPLALSAYAARHTANAAHKLWHSHGALPRLWLVALALKQSRDCALCCASCGRPVARHSHMFAMSSDGAHAHYANPGGYTHNIITVRETHGVVTAGGASTEYSWFPGYSWAVMMCSNCHCHLGWKFKALKPTLRPQRFYGLCRNYITPLSNSSESGSENNTLMADEVLTDTE